MHATAPRDTLTRSVEDYLRAGGRPLWMERLMEIKRGMARERRGLARAHAALREQVAPEEFPARWRAVQDRLSPSVENRSLPHEQRIPDAIVRFRAGGLGNGGPGFSFAD